MKNDFRSYLTKETKTQPKQINENRECKQTIKEDTITMSKEELIELINKIVKREIKKALESQPKQEQKQEQTEVKKEQKQESKKEETNESIVNRASSILDGEFSGSSPVLNFFNETQNVQTQNTTNEKGEEVINTKPFNMAITGKAMSLLD